MEEQQKASMSKETFWERTWPQTWYRFPLRPIFKKRKANRWNTTCYSFSWGPLSLWTMDSLSFSLEIDIEESIMIKSSLPYLRVMLGIPILPISFLQRFWRKPVQ